MELFRFIRGKVSFKINIFKTGFGKIEKLSPHLSFAELNLMKPSLVVSEDLFTK